MKTGVKMYGKGKRIKGFRGRERGRERKEQTFIHDCRMLEMKVCVTMSGNIM